MRRWIGLILLGSAPVAGVGCAEYQEQRHVRTEAMKDSLQNMKTNRERFGNTTGPETSMPMPFP